MTRVASSFVASSAGAAGLLLSAGILWFSPTVADPDLWGHVRFGQDILRTGSIIQKDVYSYRIGDQPWINHEWLSEVIYAYLFDHGGSTTLVVFKLVISLLVLLGCFVYLRACGLGPWRAVLFCLLVSVPLRMGLGTIRPQSFTYLCFLVELILLATATTGRERRLWLLPALFAVWVNLHGGVLAGAGILLLWLAGFLARQQRGSSESPTARPAAIVAVGLLLFTCACALALNPYGLKLVGFLLRTATVPRPEISEWNPLLLRRVPGMVYGGLLVLAIAGFAFNRQAATFEGLLFVAATAVLTLISARHFPLFALAVVVMAGEPIAGAWNRATPAAWSRFGQRPLVNAISLVLCPVLIVGSLPRFGCIRIDPFYFAFPARVVELLRQSGVEGNMAVPFEWGEYVLWHLGPAIKVSIDGRRETVYSDSSYAQLCAFAEGNAGWDAMLKEWRTDFVLVPNGAPPVGLLARDEGWLPLYQDTFCVLFVRAGYAGLDKITARPVPVLPDNGAGLCFPASSGASGVRAR